MERYGRRDFLRRLGRAAASVAAAPLAAPIVPALAAGPPTPPRAGPAPGGGAPASPLGRARSDLPPPTVGLRSLGGSFVFDPPGLLLEPGGVVHWLNIGDFHTVSAFHPANDELLPGDVPLRIPEGAEPFHSGMLGLDAGSHFSRRFQVEGVYDYFCQPHYTFGMVGRLVVGGPRGGPAERPASELVGPAREALPDVATIAGSRGRAYEWSARLNGVLLLRAARSGGIDGPSGDPAAAARAVAEGIGVDREMLHLLDRSGGRGRLLDGVERVVEEAASGSYEALVSLADAAKAPLREALEASRDPETR